MGLPQRYASSGGSDGGKAPPAPVDSTEYKEALDAVGTGDPLAKPAVGELSLQDARF